MCARPRGGRSCCLVTEDAPATAHGVLRHFCDCGPLGTAPPPFPLLWLRCYRAYPPNSRRGTGTVVQPREASMRASFAVFAGYRPSLFAIVLYGGEDKDFAQPKYVDAKVEIVTAGYLMPPTSVAGISAQQWLRIRTLVQQVILPALEYALGETLGDDNMVQHDVLEVVVGLAHRSATERAEGLRDGRR